jgi:lysozyme
LKLLGKAKVSANQLGALVSFAYNIGSGALAKSTLLKKHLAADYAGVACEFPKWKFGGGQVLPGLIKRRAAEAALYLS